MVTQNQLTGLKLVNGAPFRAVDIFPNLAFNAITLTSDDPTLKPTGGRSSPVRRDRGSYNTQALERTILIKSKTVAIPNSMRDKGPRSGGKPGFYWVTHRTRPLCTLTFTITDQKSQRKQFAKKSFSTSKAFTTAVQ